VIARRRRIHAEPGFIKIYIYIPAATFYNSLVPVLIVHNIPLVFISLADLIWGRCGTLQENSEFEVQLRNCVAEIPAVP